MSDTTAASTSAAAAAEPTTTTTDAKITTCEVPLLFKGNAEPVILRDRSLIKTMPVVVRAIEMVNFNWETEDVVVPTIDVPFPKSAGEFIFKHIRKYVSPHDNLDDLSVENYPEANQMNTTDLKQILELANYFECNNFMHCIGYVIASKLSPKHVNEIAAYLGIEMEPEEMLRQREDGWVYPPSEIFENN